MQRHNFYVAALSGPPTYFGVGTIFVENGISHHYIRASRAMYHIIAQSKSVHIAHVWMTNSTFGVKFAALPPRETQESLLSPHTKSDMDTVQKQIFLN